MALAVHYQPRPVTVPLARPLPRPAAARQRTQRTYARRRAVVAALVGLVIGGGFFARSAVAEKPRPAGGIEMPRTITAVQGDTLWAIAHRLAPQGNVVDLVDRLVELNGDQIIPGQQIRIP
jgi:LysM repeat protein